MSNFCVNSDIRTALIYTGCFPGGGEVYYFSFGPAAAYEIEGAEVENLAAVVASVFMDAGCELQGVWYAFDAGFHGDRQGLPIPSIRKAIKNVLLSEPWRLRFRCYIRDYITVNINKDKPVGPFYQTVFF